MNILINPKIEMMDRVFTPVLFLAVVSMEYMKAVVALPKYK